MTKEVEYSLPASVLQSIASNLEEQPAKVVRGLLNFIEHTVKTQDEARKSKETLPSLPKE